jgi:hypothetical protein
VILKTGVSVLAACSDGVLINDWEASSLYYNKYVSSYFTKSPAAGIATFCEPRLMSQVGRVCIDQCVSAIRVLEVPLFLRTLSCSIDMSVASIIGSYWATPGVLDDMSCLPFVKGQVCGPRWTLGLSYMVTAEDYTVCETCAEGCCLKSHDLWGITPV